MQDENREEQTPVPGTEPTAPPVQPPAESEEVVSWYVRPDRAREVQDCYVQPRPMPAAAIPKAAPEKKPHSRRGLWIFLIVLAVLVGTVLGVAMMDGKARVTVRNVGDTIPAEELPLLFERFHKSDKSRSEDKDGYGLGLYIVKTILQQHKEEINVTSEDGVTTFTFSLRVE